MAFTGFPIDPNATDGTQLATILNTFATDLDARLAGSLVPKAMGRVDASGTFTGAGATVAKGGVGTYTLTLTTALSGTTRAVVNATAMGTISVTAVVTVNSVSSISVRTFKNGADPHLVDAAFSFVVQEA